MKTNSLKSIINNIINEYESIGNTNQFLNTLNSLRPKLISVAQEVYNEWDQDDDGYDDVYGEGGICDDIAEKMADVINGYTNYTATYLYNEHDTHTSVYVYDIKTKQICNIDIPPYVYEKGYGYKWKKIPDVVFKPSNIEINMLTYDDYIDDNGELKSEFN